MSAARPHREWIWLAALLLLVSLHFWFPRVGQGPRHDTYSTSAEGKKAFYLLARSRGHEVTRNQQPLPVLVESLQGSVYGSDTLCLLGPARYPTDAEWERLMEWVAGGGSLLVAARSGRGGEKLEFTIPGLGVGVKPGSGSFETTDVDTQLMNEGEFIWQSGGEIDAPDAGEMERLVEAGGTAQAVGLSHGGGYVVVVASDFVFSNQSLAWSDYANAELAVRLLEAAREPDSVSPGGRSVSPGGRSVSPGGVYLDESLNSSGTPKVVGLLLEPFLRPVTVQLLIALLLFAWWRSRPFGPLLPRSVKARHNIVDHTDTLGLLYFKGNNGTAPLKSYLAQLESELRLGSAKGAEDRALAPVAARLDKSVDVVRKLFDRARHHAKAGELDRKTAAKIIHRLSLVRRAMSQPPAKATQTQPPEDS